MPLKKKIYPWKKHYPKGIKWNVKITPQPLFRILEDSARKYPNNLCLEFEGAKWSYAETLNLVNKVAHGLQEAGVKPGVRVGLFLPNCPYFVISYYAILKIGAVVVNYNPLYAIGELAHQIKDSGTSVLITLDQAMLYEKASNLLQTTPLEKVIVGKLTNILPFPKNKLFEFFKSNEIASVNYSSAILSLESFFSLPGTYQHVEINPKKNIAVLQYTGGTTGAPKGAMLSHANLHVNAVQCGMWFAGLDEGKETMMAVLPFFHVFAMTAIMNFAILNGFSILLVPKFSLHKLVRHIHKKKPTILPGVPTLFAAINNFQDLKKYNLSSIKAAVAGGAPLPVEIKKKFEELTGCKLIEGYGLTESSPVVAANPLYGENKEGSIGMPLPGTIIEIVKNKKVAKEKNIGEICVKGPQVMLGYWNNEEETENVIKDGFLHTGDLGYIDHDGYIFVVDRLKEIIITSGFNVYPREIEELLYKHTSISEAAVIGVPDKYKGERVKAVIKLRDGEFMQAEDVHDYLDGKLAKYKLPEEVEFVKEIPKTLIGKVSKKDLKGK